MPILRTTMSAPLAFAPSPELLFGLMLVAAIVGGHAARAVHVPRVVGFLLAGVGLHLILSGGSGSGGGVDAGEAWSDAAEPLGALRDLALGLILFTIGGVFERTQLRAVGPRILKISAVEIGASALLVFVGCLTVALARSSADDLGDGIALALLLAAAAVATAPAATLFVLQEYESKGPVSDTILGLTAINNIVCIVLFHATFLILFRFGVIQTSGDLTEHVWPALIATSLGSVALGGLCGLLLSIFHGKLPVAETLLVFFAMFLLLGSAEHWLLQRFGLSYNFLLSALVIGAVFTNIAIDPRKLTVPLRTMSAPILAGFFVIAGFGLHVNELGSMGWIGGVYVLCRYFGKVLGCRLGMRWSGGSPDVGRRVGAALLCQAAVVIGLTAFVQRHWQSAMAARFATVILGSVVVFELIGPLLVKRCVLFCGEVKAITLLSRSGPATEGASIVAITLGSLLRLFRRRPDHERSEPSSLTVAQVMRTNVLLIPASATFDEVLHLIERSTYSHFPVVNDDGDFAGVIHFSDIRDVIYDPRILDLVTAIDLADPAAAYVPKDLQLESLLDTFTAADVGVLAVVQGAGSKRILGVVELRDLLKALHVSQRVR